MEWPILQLWVTVKFWSQYLQYLKSYLEIFIRHLAAVVYLLKTDNTSPICRYIIEIWPVLEKIAFCLQRSGTNINICLFPARRSHFRVSHHATYCALRSLTSSRPFVHTCSHFDVRVRRRHMLHETARAPAQVPHHFDGARGCEPVGLSSRLRLILLASHCMALTREHKNPSQIAREIEIFSIFARLPMLGLHVGPEA